MWDGFFLWKTVYITTSHPPTGSMESNPGTVSTSKTSYKHIDYLDVSENSGTPKSSILIGVSILNHPFWGTPIFGNTHLVTRCHEISLDELYYIWYYMWKNTTSCTWKFRTFSGWLTFPITFGVWWMPSMELMLSHPNGCHSGNGIDGSNPETKEI